MGAIQETNYHDFADRAIAKAKDGRMPVEAVFELTFRCVLKCKHCYTACNQYADQEMTAIEWCRLIDEAADGVVGVFHPAFALARRRNIDAAIQIS